MSKHIPAPIGMLLESTPAGKLDTVKIKSHSYVEPNPFELTLCMDKTPRTTEQIYDEAKEARDAYNNGKASSLSLGKEGVLYLAGPMSGYNEHNFPLFNRVAAMLRAQGWYVLNPAENFKGDASHSYEVHYLADIKLVELCDTIAFLPDWQKSGGAVGEYVLGDRLNKKLFTVKVQEPDGTYGGKASVDLVPLKLDSVTFTPFKRNQRDETVLQEADRLVATDRQGQYGHPYDDFSRTAALWTGAGFGFFDDRTESYRSVSAEDIAIAMMLLKISRIVNLPKRDSIVDAAGYAKTLDLVIKKRQELEAPKKSK
jgi:hypothetical protein